MITKSIYFELNLLYDLKAGGSTGLLMDLAANEKDVHADFFNGKQMLQLL